MKTIKLTLAALIAACSFQIASAQVRVGVKIGDPAPRRTVVVNNRHTQREVIVDRRHPVQREVIVDRHPGQNTYVRRTTVKRSYHRRYNSDHSDNRNY
jgi:hypothetical protein